jgi:6-pyruvoyl-tetrahydropterin synthase
MSTYTRKTITVHNPETGKTFWKYHDTNQRAREYYHSTQKESKSIKVFYKHLDEGKMIPQNRSLERYKPTIEYIEKLMLDKVEAKIEDKIKIETHYQAIIDRLQILYSDV